VTYDVVIAGAGPVGLFLACELRLARLSVLVLELAGDASAPLKRLPFGLRGLSMPTLEAFYRRRLLAEIRPGTPAPFRSTERRQAGHFGGIPFQDNQIDRTKWVYQLPNPADTTMATDMQHLETVLSARATAMGVEILRGLGVHAFEQSGGEVVLGAGDQSFRARWLVGCDGGRSVVRKLGGFEFHGTEPRFTGYSVAVELSDPDALPMGRHYTPTGMYVQSQPGIIAMVDFDGGTFHRSAPITREHVQDVLRRVTGLDVTVNALRLATTWTDRAQQATSYRKGRVLLAGDAAHIHSPLGGQGLNLGLGDAMNLGWKLAATVKDTAPSDLLDSYSAERQPIGAAVLDWSRAQVALMEPSPDSRALRGIVGDLMDTRDGATYFAERLWGVSLRYDLGGQHALVGRSAPDFELADGTRLGVVLRDGLGVLLNFDQRPALRSLSHLLPGDLKYIEGEPKDGLGLSGVLVRPDGVVAWACADAPDIGEATHALSQWLSPHRVVSQPR
jgi:2-polyprenyl-6-methoxyphenol hydroxylase-like FAD-dependent oxidoreductase